MSHQRALVRISLQVVAGGLASKISLQIGGYLLQLARPCWSPRSLTPFFWRSGAHISWQANYWQPLRFGEEPRRELSISCGHPGTRHHRLRESDHTVTMPTMKPNPAHFSPILSISQVANILPLQEARHAHWFKLVVMAQAACSTDCLKFVPGACQLPLQGKL